MKCGKLCSTAKELNQHLIEMKDDHADILLHCKAPGCRKFFVTDKELKTHARIKHLKAKCEYCQKDVRKYYMKRHIRSVHAHEFETVCDLCGKTLKTKSAYKVHYDTEHKEQIRVQCETCKAWYD